MKMRRWLAVLTVVLLTVCLAGQIWAAAANDALDTERECTLKVSPCNAAAQGNSEMAADLAKVDIVIDLYKVADWKVEGTKYGFTSAEAYGLDIPADITNDGWTQVAQQAAGKALLPEVSKPDLSINGETKLASGVYLLVAHKQGDSDYVKTITDDTGNARIVTQLKTEQYLYTFNPELVALPSKMPEAGAVNTANPGEWIYDLEANLKPERSMLKGDLEIVKTLLTYEASAQATFVFQLDWDEDGRHHSDVRSLTFTAAGVRSLKVEGFPVGTVVTVQEVYSGAKYVLKTDPEQTAVIKADDVVQVSFENDYDEENPPPKGGGSITNRFTYGDNGWEWEKLVDNTNEYGPIE